MDSPFVDFKATELSVEKIKDLFVEPKHISKLYPSKATFIIGQRGTGKTTILKYLAECYNKYNGESKARLGVYFRFEIQRMAAFRGDFLNQDQWEKLFSHAISIFLCIGLTSVLIKQKKHYKFAFEKQICDTVVSCLCDDRQEHDINTFEELLDLLEIKRIDIYKYIRNYSKFEMPTICDYGTIFENYCQVISSENILNSTCVHFLLDEYENLLTYQQKIINTFVKNASQYHTFKICVRPNGIKTNQTLTSEYIRVIDDYMCIDYNEDILGDFDETKQFAIRMCAKRLELYYKANEVEYTDDELNIENYLEKISDNDEFDIISKKKIYRKEIEEKVKKLISNHSYEKIDYNFLFVEENFFLMRLLLVLSEKRNFDLEDVLHSMAIKDNKYKGWEHNYKKAVLYLCCYESQTQKAYSGIDDFIYISGKVIRYILEMCHYTFSMAESLKNRKGKINATIQTDAIKLVASIRFEQINTIPDKGYELKQLINCIGKIFSALHKDTKIACFEPNHFSIAQRSKALSIDSIQSINYVLKLGLTWGVLIESKSTKEKNANNIIDDDIDYSLHPIFSPYFQISFRKKQKCVFLYDEINNMIFGTVNDRDRTVKRYLKNKPVVDSAQLSMLED